MRSAAQPRGDEARQGEHGKPTPEGMHRDGVDYVLVLLVNRRNIQSGTTTVHDLDKRTLGSFTLTDPEGKTTIKVREGDVFEWPSEPNASYKVIDLRADQVVVKDERSGDTVTIPRM